MATGFDSARSGLATLGAFGRRVRGGEPYRSLADLLRYDEKLATLDLKVCVGADGRIRGFEILSIQENQENPFVSSTSSKLLRPPSFYCCCFACGCSFDTTTTPVEETQSSRTRN